MYKTQKYTQYVSDIQYTLALKSMGEGFSKKTI